MRHDAQTLNDAKQQAYRLLSYRSRSARELRDRLQQRGYGTSIIDEALRQLAAEGYVDDYKFALDWARYRLQARPMGRRRLAWELQQRGIEPESLEEVLREVYVEFDEATLAEQAIHKRLRTRGALLSVRERQQLARYLIGLGFEPDTIAAALTVISPSMSPHDIALDDDAG